MPGTNEPVTAGASSSSDELALLVKNVLDYAIFVISPTGTIRSWNAGAERTMGYTENEAVGSNFSRFYGPEDLASKKPQWELQEAAAHGRIEDEGWRIRKDGTRFWADTVITALRDDSGELKGFAKITRDLTERRSAEEQLRQSEEVFRLLVDSVQDYAIFMLDPGGYITSWNSGAQRIKGYQPDEIIGKHFSVFYSQEDIAAKKPERELKEAIERGRVEDEGWRLRKDGTVFWANVLITAVRDERGVIRGFAKVTRDITARREAEETRRALLEQREARLLAEEEKRRAESASRSAHEANRAKDEFLMTLSHELRTPMTAIVGWSRMLPTMQPNDPIFREALRSIARSADLQSRLLDDVLDVSRIVSGKLRLSLERVDVIPVLQSAMDAVIPSAQARSITLKASLDPEVGTATLDATRLQQIVWNLLSNAVKFTPPGGRVELSAKRTASHLEIAVTDTGRGIDPQFLPYVFEPFRQAETPATRTHGGLGLGLSIARYLVEAHGGSVSAESQGLDKGSRFIVSLPVAALQRPEDVRPKVMARDEEPTRQLVSLVGNRILVVDDDPEGRELVAAALRIAGAELAVADSADAALDYLKTHTADLVLTDIAMPNTDGFALQRKLRERGDLAKTRIVALTAFPASSVSDSKEEFDSCLRKPIDPYELAQRVSDVLLRLRVE